MQGILERNQVESGDMCVSSYSRVELTIPGTEEGHKFESGCGMNHA